MQKIPWPLARGPPLISRFSKGGKKRATGVRVFVFAMAPFHFTAVSQPLAQFRLWVTDGERGCGGFQGPYLWLVSTPQFVETDGDVRWRPPYLGVWLGRSRRPAAHWLFDRVTQSLARSLNPSRGQLNLGIYRGIGLLAPVKLCNVSIYVGPIPEEGPKVPPKLWTTTERENQFITRFIPILQFYFFRSHQ